MIKDTLRALCTTYGPTGNEGTIANLIRSMVADVADEIKTDALGNLIVIKKGQKEGTVMFSAHMDEIGLMITYIEEDGFLRCTPVGGVNPVNARYRQVRFENGTVGILGSEPAKPAELTMDKLYIDIGCATREEARKKVEIGDICAFTGEYLDMGDRVSTKSLDNRAGCAVVVEALRALPTDAMTVAAVFSTQEEVGLRGAKTAAWSVNPDVGIALDVTPAGDTPKADKLAMTLGKGPCIKIKDASVICAPSVVKWLEDAAKEGGIVCQREVLPYGGTDTAAIQLTGSGIPAGCISIATRYVHSQAETAQFSDMELAVQLLVQAAKMGYNS